MIYKIDFSSLTTQQPTRGAPSPKDLSESPLREESPHLALGDRTALSRYNANRHPMQNFGSQALTGINGDSTFFS
jgi:hypothetical protein